MSKKNPKIKGIVFKHEGKNDYSIWMPDFTNDADNKFLQALVAVSQITAPPFAAPKKTSYKLSLKTCDSC